VSAECQAFCFEDWGELFPIVKDTNPLVFVGCTLVCFILPTARENVKEWTNSKDYKAPPHVLVRCLLFRFLKLRCLCMFTLENSLSQKNTDFGVTLGWEAVAY
jgi:hypothetical protein